MLRLPLAFLLLLSSLAHADTDEDRRFDGFVDAYYQQLPSVRPSQATALGFHEHDGDLEDLSQAAVARETARLQQWKQRLDGVDAKKLTPERAADLQLLRSSIDAALLELTGVQAWRHQPDFYAGLASRSVYVIIQRNFAPAEARMKSVIAREKKMPQMLHEARNNLVDVPRIYLEIALDELPGIIGFFQKDVPSAFESVKDPALKAQLAETTKQVTAALDDYGAWLKKDVAPHAKEGFAIGEAKFRAKLKAEEMIDTPLDELLKRGDNELHRLQKQFKEVAKQIDPKKPFAEVQKEVQRDHGSADRLIADVQSRLAGLRQFLVAHKIVTLPSEIMPRVEETPPFMRATTQASMDTPGPFEKKATEAFYNVTLPEKNWTSAQVEDFLRGAFNHPLIDVVSIHEAFPGHYVQFLWMPLLKSKVRKYEGANTNVEGWAHYCEQMMLDEGYGDGNPKLRLAQLQDALLRAARYVVGIRMHTRGMTFQQAVQFFQKEGYQSAQVAEIEAKRGSEDPTYLYYTLGKLEILKLRDDYKKKLGAAYSLEKFHDAFLAQGALPLPLMRQALLAN